MTVEHATFAAGCFWGVEAEFRKVDGVTDVTSGYTGGQVERPTYEIVCSGASGHAEAVEIAFDPEHVSYGELLDLFFSLHDPTQVDRQGPDVGTQYRSAIFVHNDNQKKAAHAAIERLQAQHKRPIATHVDDAPEFWQAEDYHQRFFEKKGIRRWLH